MENEQESRIFSVSEINQILKNLLDGTPFFRRVYVRGELSNYKIYPSGHHYFTLKDPEGVLRCVMFRSNASRLRFRPENGMKVILSGQITVFPRDGQYQLYCASITPEGIGDLHVAYAQLKEKLYQEGLFDNAHKQPLPAYPERIALITSGSGAAVHDMIRILRKRYPICKVIVLPVRVQGKEAPPEIVGAIRYANRWRVADLLIVGRGGGSMEDLWAFNDERVARAIYASELPVISAVGHEPDVTISDFVADLRAATPSNAAELAVPDRMELTERFAALKNRMARAEVQQLRRGLEIQSLILAVQAADFTAADAQERWRQSLEPLRKLVEQMRQATGRDRVACDSAFHEALIQCSANRLFAVLQKAISSLCEAAIENVLTAATDARWQALVDCHEEIYQCLLSRDVQGGIAAIDRHYAEPAPEGLPPA